MSLPIASAGAASALPSLSVHSHGHGHKKGLESATDSTSDTDAPAGSTQSLFSNLLTSMEQVVGAQPAHGSTQTPGSTQPVSMNKTGDSGGCSAFVRGRCRQGGVGYHRIGLALLCLSLGLAVDY